MLVEDDEFRKRIKLMTIGNTEPPGVSPFDAIMLHNSFTCLPVIRADISRNVTDKVNVLWKHNLRAKIQQPPYDLLRINSYTV